MNFKKIIVIFVSLVFKNFLYSFEYIQVDEGDTASVVGKGRVRPCVKIGGGHLKFEPTLLFEALYIEEGTAEEIGGRIFRQGEVVCDSEEQACILQQNWAYRAGDRFTQIEFSQAMELLRTIENRTEVICLEALKKIFSVDRAHTIYLSWPHRPGTDFTNKEFNKAMMILRNTEEKTEEACLEALQKEFPYERARALYLNWPLRPGADFTRAEYEQAIKYLQIVPSYSFTGAKCLQELYKHFSPERASALYQNWPLRPGADFTNKEFDRAMAMILAAGNKTKKGFLETLQQEFSPARAVALYQRCPQRPDVDFTETEFQKAMAMILSAGNKTKNDYLEILQQEFSPARAVALYQSWPQRPDADFTDAELEKALELLKDVPEKTEAACLEKLRQTFSDGRAEALFINRPDRPGCEFTSFESSKATWLLQKAASKSKDGYLTALKAVFSAERAQALLDAFISGDLIAGIVSEKATNEGKNTAPVA